MDMSNATAAGPDRGILDLLFGAKNQPEPQADGKTFGGLMDLIKALKEKQESLGAEAGRTLGDTAMGKGGIEIPTVGMPMNNASAEIAARLKDDESEREKRLAMLFSLPMSQLVQDTLPPELPTAQPEQVDAILQQKQLDPLSPQESKLLQDINAKIEQANAHLGSTIPKAALEPPMLDPRLAEALKAKGLDTSKLKAAEATVATEASAPQKILTTETYLKMHEGMNKDAAKDVKAPAPGAGEANAPQAKAAEAITSQAVAGVSGKALKHEGGSLSSGLQAGKDHAGSETMDGSLVAGSMLAAQKQEVAKHDVFLPGASKPDETRKMLLEEMGSNVSLTAVKGGGEMRLVLHPHDLGEVKLKVGTKNGQVEVQVTAENEEVAKLLRSGSKELEKSLKEQSMALASFEVSVQDPTKVANTDTRTNLSDQYLQQNQQQHANGFGAGANGGERGESRWDSGLQAFNSSERAAPRSAGSAPKSAPRDSSRRLDIVA